MFFLHRMLGNVFAGRKGPRGNRRSPSRARNRRLTMEYMEPRVMMSANPLCNAVAHNLDIGAVPALVAENLPHKGPGGKGPIFTAPAAPSLTAYPMQWANGGYACLGWNSVSGATGYVVELWVPTSVRLVNGHRLIDRAHWEQIAFLGSGATFYQFNVGENVSQQEYTFRVGATNTAGTTWSAPASTTGYI
jgi:hypothetical protein